jgi:glycosyltransferase involved in cell wall biosynthesis
MKLLVVTPRFVPDLGGVERHVYETTRRFADRGVDVTVLAADPTHRRAAREQIDGVTVRRVHSWPETRDWYVAPGIWDVISHERWDIVHVQSWHTAVAPLALAAAYRRGIPYVVTPHGRGYATRFRKPLRPLQRRSLAPLLRRARHVIALARFERELLIDELSLAPEQVSVIPNGSDLDIPVERSPDGGPPTVVSIGRLERFKGHHRLVAALPLVLAAEPEARVVIVGEGPYEVALRQLAESYNVADRVTFTSFGMFERATLAQLLADASLVVLLSEYETHPIAVLEAAALGTPAVVTDVGGMRDLAQDGLATAVPLNVTAPELATVICEHLAHPPVLPAVRLMSWDDCAEAVMRIYGGTRVPQRRGYTCAY